MAKSAQHIADTLRDETRVVFTAQSAKNFHQRMLICRHVFEQGYTPINPFTNFGYYLYELVERNLVRQGNNTLMRRADELWVYGDISDGVASEIRFAHELRMPIRYFSIENLPDSPVETTLDKLPFETDAKSARDNLLRLKI